MPFSYYYVFTCHAQHLRTIRSVLLCSVSGDFVSDIILLQSLSVFGNYNPKLLL
jgi:hypothetical protein